MSASSDLIVFPKRTNEGFDALPAYPSSRAEEDLWRAWSAAQFSLRRAPVLALTEEEVEGDASRNRLQVAWRALIGYWAGERGVSSDDAPLIMYYLLQHAHQAPPLVLTAAKRLARATIRSGTTSADALFLLATFAWPLRDVDVELSQDAWQLIVHAPWQSDPLTQRDLILAVHRHEAWRDHRGLMDLIDARQGAGLGASARSFLEAVALVQTRQDRIEQISSYRDFIGVELVQGAHRAIVRLANLYIELQEDQVYAREVLKRAAELTRSAALVRHIETRPWDRPLDEVYAWSEQLTHPRHLDGEIERALSHGQPHHARRMAEAVLIRKYKRLWYGSAVENLPGALERFEQELQLGPPADPVVRRAAEHLATLYMRTHHVTQSARAYVRAIAGSIAFTGRGAELYPLREELEWFYNRSDPYYVLRREDALLGSRREVLSDDELRASDAVQRWFAQRFNGRGGSAMERLARALVAPIADAARLLGRVPMMEQACAATFRLAFEQGRRLSGDLEALARHGAEIRSQYGHGLKLIEYAREVTRTEAIAASALAGVMGFMPPGLGALGHATDLGSSLMLAYRAVARVAAVFGRLAPGADGAQLIADAFSVGLSSRDGEGLLMHLTRPRGELATAITIGGVTYAGTRLVSHLWAVPRADGSPRHAEQLIRHLARVCGFEIEERGLARAVPAVGAVLNGVSTYALMQMITEAAIHVAARDALLIRVNAYETT